MPKIGESIRKSSQCKACGGKGINSKGGQCFPCFEDNEENRINETVENMISILETPVNGVPSIEVINRGNTHRLLKSAIVAIWRARNGIERPKKNQGK